MSNKKIVILKKKDFENARTWGGHFALYDKSELEDHPNEFVEVELVPITKTKGFPIEIEPARNDSKNLIEWAKIYDAWKEMKFSVPIKITLDSDLYSNIGIHRIGDYFFSFLDIGESEPLSGILDIEKVLDMKDIEIQKKLIVLLQNFLKDIPNQTQEIHNKIHIGKEIRRICHTLKHPDPEMIRVVR